MKAGQISRVDNMAITAKNMDEMQGVLYMVDYPTFARAFKESGGEYGMAKHLWDKWKNIHNDNFLAEYGNMDLQNKRTTAKMLNKLIKLHRNQEAWRKYGYGAWADYGERRKLGKVA
jgi:hypothetical protein